jgi:hypothetical protein
MLEATIAAAQAAGEVQVLVGAHLDEAKRAMLFGDQFTIAWEWRVRDV